ncbi:MAG TPA: GNAT family N-acetyltransferase [Chthonomonadaceae bacterium]|nr:GNAT family N-acetyltransferase [Chthonomonadaceae bacterium]
MLRAECVDPCLYVEEAAAILRAAWQPPSLHYTADYLDWQFRFPAPLRSCGALAYEGSTPVGFIGATPRTLRLAENEQAAYVVSFVAVRPDWRGRGIASLLYRTLLTSDLLTTAPVVTFAESDSAGERALQRSYPDAGYSLSSLGEYPLHGYLPRLQSPETSLQVIEAPDVEAFHAAARLGTAPQTLWNAPTPDILQHYLRDPRPRRLLLCLADGEPTGCAMLLHADLQTAHGHDAAIMLENLVLIGDQAEALKALCAYSSQYGKASGSNGSVMLPNPCGISAQGLKAAGLRQLPSRFRGYLCCTDPQNALLQAAETNIEII